MARRFHLLPFLAALVALAVALTRLRYLPKPPLPTMQPGAKGLPLGGR